MKIICVYHSRDLDGQMSAAIVKKWFVEKYSNSYYVLNENGSIDKTLGISENLLNFLGYDYGQPIPDLSEYDKVIMCDISFPSNIMNELTLSLEKNFIWIDHHISAINSVELFEDLINGLRDTKFAACELTWKYFMQGIHGDADKTTEVNPIPEIVRLLGLYDTFRHKGTKEEQKVLEFQYGARSIIKNYEDAYDFLLIAIEQEKSWMSSSFTVTGQDTVMSRILDMGSSIYSYLSAEAKEIYKKAFHISFTCVPVGDGIVKDVEFLCVNENKFNPNSFDCPYTKDGYDGFATFRLVGKMWSFTLFSETIDCSEIAKYYGGGGHRVAAGMSVDTETMMEIINSVQ